MLRLVRRTRNAMGALLLLAALVPAVAWSPPARAALPLFRVVLDDPQEWPGQNTYASFSADGFVAVDCEVWWDGGRPQRCLPGSTVGRITVPADAPPGKRPLNWKVWYVPEGQRAVPGEDLPAESGVADFLVLGVEASADRAEVDPGDALTVTFTTVDPKLTLTTCGLDPPFAADCRPAAGSIREELRIIVPEGIDPGEHLVGWHATSRWPFQDDQPTLGAIPVTVRESPGPAVSTEPPPPPPDPEFQARAETDTIGPGQPFVVTFLSLTPGVTVEECGLTLGKRAACGGSDVAVVMIPPRTPPDTTLRLPWDLTYAGEQSGRTGGELQVRVVVERSEIAVTVQPAAARAGEEIDVTFESRRPGVEIAECIAFFPNDAGGICEETAERWFARTSVPEGTAPGATLLRWGVASLTAAGAPLADDGVVAFTVLPPITPAPPPTPEPTDPTREEPTPEQPTPAQPAPTQPAPTQPGPITQPGPTTEATPAPLPTTAEPPPPAGGRPVFAVDVTPDAVAPGGQVTVAHRPLGPGVTITGCRAGFSAGGTMADCRASGDGWVADVVVPAGAPPGTGTVLWNVAYTAAGNVGNGTADGLATLDVLDVATEPKAAGGWWRTVTGLAGRVLLGAGVVVALLLWRGGLDRLRRWWDERRIGAVPEDVLVKVLEPAPAATVGLSAPEDEPGIFIGIVPVRGDPRIGLREEPS